MRYRLLLTGSAILAILLMLVGIATGAAQLSVSEVASILWTRLTGGDPTALGHTLAASEIV